jgi:ATP-dependent helicase STH1/SNF2
LFKYITQWDIGTPLQNNLPELWALLNFLLPYIFGSMESFDQWFNQPFAAFQKAKDVTNVDTNGDNEMAQLSQEERLLVVHRLHEVLRPFMLRRVKSQVLDQLPDKVEMVMRCRLSGWQKQLYRVIQERGRSLDGEAARGGINNVLMQLRKVTIH